MSGLLYRVLFFPRFPVRKAVRVEVVFPTEFPFDLAGLGNQLVPEMEGYEVGKFLVWDGLFLDKKTPGES